MQLAIQASLEDIDIFGDASYGESSSQAATRDREDEMSIPAVPDLIWDEEDFTEPTIPEDPRSGSTTPTPARIAAKKKENEKAKQEGKGKGKGKAKDDGDGDEW